jgi:hypothetical protein
VLLPPLPLPSSYHPPLFLPTNQPQPGKKYTLTWAPTGSRPGRAHMRPSPDPTPCQHTQAPTPLSRPSSGPFWVRTPVLIMDPVLHTGAARPRSPNRLIAASDRGPHHLTVRSRDPETRRTSPSAVTNVSRHCTCLQGGGTAVCWLEAEDLRGILGEKPHHAAFSRRAATGGPVWPPQGRASVGEDLAGMF